MRAKGTITPSIAVPHWHTSTEGCLELILATFRGSEIVPPEEVDLLHQQAFVDEWNGAPPSWARSEEVLR